MPDKTLQEILKHCLSIEEEAADMYAAFSDISYLDDHKAFWGAFVRTKGNISFSGKTSF